MERLNSFLKVLSLFAKGRKARGPDRNSDGIATDTSKLQDYLAEIKERIPYRPGPPLVGSTYEVKETAEVLLTAAGDGDTIAAKEAALDILALAFEYLIKLDAYVKEGEEKLKEAQTVAES